MCHREKAGSGVGHRDRSGVTPLSLFSLERRLPMIGNEEGDYDEQRLGDLAG